MLQVVILTNRNKKHTHSVHNHIPSFRKWLAKESETLFTSNRKSFVLTLMLRFLHTVYSKNRMKPQGALLHRGSKKRWKMWIHDGQSWHSNCKKIYVLYMIPNKNWTGYFGNSIRKNWPASTGSPHWTMMKTMMFNVLQSSLVLLPLSSCNVATL